MKKTTLVSSEDLALASAAIAPLNAVEGRYFTVEGYTYFDTLTALKLDSGQVVYFATNGKAPFGSLKSGLSIAATRETRDITGFGSQVPSDGSAGMDAAKIFADHGAKLY